MTGSTPDLIIFWAVVAARFLVPLLIPRFPLPAIIAALVIDAADQSIFQSFTDLDLEGYQSYDKALDIYYLTITYVSVLRNWTNGFAAEVARFLWYYRLVGVVLFEATQIRALLFVFPNTFEYYVIAYEVIRTAWDPRRLTRRRVLALAAFVWVVIKLPQEWWIHIAQNDFTDFLQERIFGVPAGSPWSQSFSERPWVLAVLAILAVGLAFAVVRLRSRLPARDWSVRFDVDRPVPEIPASELPAEAVDGSRGPALRWPRLEKVVLIALVSSIFAQFLEIGATGLQIVVATTLVVIVNSVVSPLVVYRATDWRTIAIEFAVLAVINTALLAIYASLVGESGLNRTVAWFFGLLLTLIITLYDRYRTMRLERTA